MIVVSSATARLCGPGALSGPTDRGSVFSLDGIGERQCSRAHLGIRLSDRARVRSSVRMIEARDCGVKLLPKLSGPAAARPRTKLVRRLCVLGPGNRTPSQPQTGSVPAHRRLRRGGFSEGPEATRESQVGRCKPVRAHRCPPLIFDFLEALEKLPLADRPGRRIKRLATTGRHVD
jgi:hypothetical protein